MRSNRPDVRNPLLKLPSAADIQALPEEAREALRKLALDASRAWREQADECWRRHKPPMAAYWKAMAVNARHLAGLCRRGTVRP
jgi:hypothetical protein